MQDNHLSSRLFNSAKKLIPGGVNSPVRAFRNVDGDPFFVRAAKGSRLWDVDDNELIEQIKLGRKMLGDKTILAIDFGYRWKSWADAKWVLDRIEDCNIYFAEAALQHDDLAADLLLQASFSFFEQDDFFAELEQFAFP